MAERTPPRFDSKWINDFCDLHRPTPLITTGWLRVWMTSHFSDPDLLENADQTIQKMIWREDVKQTKISIESVTRWVPELTEHRPGIIIKRNGWKKLRVGIDDKMMGTWPIDAQESYTNFWQGSHTLFCVTGSGAETELLGAEVFRELNEFGPVVREILSLMRFEVVSVGELMILEQARENFVVPVTVAYAYQENWRILRERPKIRKIDLRFFEP